MSKLCPIVSQRRSSKVEVNKQNQQEPQENPHMVKLEQKCDSSATMHVDERTDNTTVL